MSSGGSSSGGSSSAGSAATGGSNTSSAAAASSASTTASIITALPAVGAVISRGQQLFELNGGPGPALLYGSRPMWRTLINGVSDGVDVLQLEQNLAALGFTDNGNMAVDSHFTVATGNAVTAWQLARGLTQTGSVTPGDVVYDSGPVRVSAYVAAVGDSASGTIYNVTGTTRSVQVDLDPANQTYVTPGARVSVTLPDGNNVDGVIYSIGTVATVSSSGGNGGGGGSTTTIPVTIVLPKQPKDALDDSPVTVNLVTSRAKNVLTVPVNALLALAEGGYAVEKVNADGSTTLVKITPGMFANGLRRDHGQCERRRNGRLGVSAVIDLAGVVKEYPGTPPIRALDGVDLRVEHGEFVAIVGPSGSGKTTLLNLLGALDRPTAGTVSVDGTEISGLRDRELSALRGRRIGFVFQTFNLIDGLDAIGNVALGLVYDGSPPKDASSPSNGRARTRRPRAPCRPQPEPALRR